MSLKATIRRHAAAAAERARGRDAEDVALVGGLVVVAIALGMWTLPLGIGFAGAALAIGGWLHAGAPEDAETRVVERWYSDDAQGDG